MTLSIFGCTIYPYGLALALGGLVGLELLRFSGKKHHIPTATLSWLAVAVIPCAFIFARLCYVLVTFPSFQNAGLMAAFALTGGGFMLYGALLGGFIAAWVVAKCTKSAPLSLLDALALPAAWIIAVARFAEGLVGQGYGWDLARWFDPEEGMSILPLEHYDFLKGLPFSIEDMYGDFTWAIFILAGLYALVVCLVLWRRAKGRPGCSFSLMLLLYAAGQILWESMRQDAVLRWGFVRVSQVISALVLLGLLLWLHLRTTPGQRKPLIPRLIGLLALLGVVMAMEFAVEKKINFLEWMTMDLCYFTMAAACAGMIGLIVPMWRRYGVEER